MEFHLVNGSGFFSVPFQAVLILPIQNDYRKSLKRDSREAKLLVSTSNTSKFIDEIDDVGRLRGTGIVGGNDEREQTLNQLLTEMKKLDKDWCRPSKPHESSRDSCQLKGAKIKSQWKKLMTPGIRLYIALIDQNSGGLTWFIPGEDPSLISKNQLFARIVGGLGERAEEEVIFGETEITTGAAGDLQQITQIARQMVTMFGMSEIGPWALTDPAVQGHDVVLRMLARN
ncbi:hypothetical protein JHK87_006749 [Glycine soja]|nr:hypothetical protein JHK87_006749 [Glycine soja]